MRLVAANPDFSQRQLASFLGVSLGHANYCLRTLLASGCVKPENYRKSRNRIAYRYILTPAGMTANAELTRQFLADKVSEHEAARVEIKGLARECAVVAESQCLMRSERE